MKRRQWTNQQKLQIVLEGIKGHTPIAELCITHGIVQSQYYKWRDLLLNGADRLFVPAPDKEKERLKRENSTLKMHIGELTVELKKTEELL